ncbi:MAG: hypothetical protein ACXACG_18380, partial [Candidatus Thorarchaeota archaeon]|jgi:hypothetical protein
MRGAGKSWIGGVFAEHLALEKIPFVIVDPEGEYWTLRVKFSNVIIAGGEQADIPLEPELAAILGNTVIDERLQCVLDLSEMRREEQTLFLSRFLTELFVKETEQRIPFWICFEEADIWVPQSGNPPCKTAVLDICQRGRKRGLGFVLISQRPATVDKTALSQAEFRFFKRFQQPHDLKAVKDYLGGHSSQVDLLPSLSVEEALMYAPTISKSPVRIIVPDRLCPHGGATPDLIAKIKPSTSILEIRDKIKGILATKRKGLNEIEKRDSMIKKLNSRIEELETELKKAELASDVAEVLVRSRKLYESKNETKIISDSPIESSAKIKPDSLYADKAPLRPQYKIPIIQFDNIGVDSRTGLIVGDDFANLVMNRMNPDERVLFLAFLGENRPTSVTEISMITGCSVKKTRKIIELLQRKGAVTRIGRSRRGYLYTVLQSF